VPGPPVDEQPGGAVLQGGGTEPVISTQELISDVKLRNSELYAECWNPLGRPTRRAFVSGTAPR